MSSTNRAKRQLSQKGALLLLIMLFALIALLTFVLCIIFGAPKSSYPVREHVPPAPTEAMQATEPTTEEPTDPPPLVSYPSRAENYQELKGQLESLHAILLDCDANETLICKGLDTERIYPASMTKVMTLAVAAEHIEDWDETITFTDEMLEPLWADDASMAGFVSGEEVTMRDLMYGAALPSGADATVGLAIATAGSEAEFVDWMNEKVAELGLQDTHFVNTSGLHDENHFTSMRDMALIMEYALMDDMVRAVLSAPEYTTKPDDFYEEGINLTSTMFNKMYGNEVQGITIKGGKTGYTDEAGQCLVSYAETPNGHRYIAVTSFGINKYSPVYDAFKMYGTITGGYPMGEDNEESESNSENEALTAA